MSHWSWKEWSIVISLAIFLFAAFLLLAGPCVIAIVRMMGG